MKNLLLTILLTVISLQVFSQNNDFLYTIRIEDKTYKDKVMTTDIIIDDTIYVSSGIDALLESKGIFKVLLKEGKHNIKAKIYDYKILDTTLIFFPERREITLVTDEDYDFHFYEFRTGFKRIYSQNGASSIIGLKSNGTFLKKSFFHISIVGCMQLESGNYRISDNQLILNVDKYESSCFKPNGIIAHRYIYTIENDSIIDLKKYDSFIEQKYGGVGNKKFD